MDEAVVDRLYMWLDEVFFAKMIGNMDEDTRDEMFYVLKTIGEENPYHDDFMGWLIERYFDVDK